MHLPVENLDGFSVRQLRELVSSIPDVDDDGNEVTVYLTAGNLYASPLTNAHLDGAGDLVLTCLHHRDLMEELETWGDYALD